MRLSGLTSAFKRKENAIQSTTFTTPTITIDVNHLLLTHLLIEGTSLVEEEKRNILCARRIDAVIFTNMKNGGAHS